MKNLLLVTVVAVVIACFFPWSERYGDAVIAGKEVVYHEGHNSYRFIMTDGTELKVSRHVFFLWSEGDDVRYTDFLNPFYKDKVYL